MRSKISLTLSAVLAAAPLFGQEFAPPAGLAALKTQAQAFGAARQSRLEQARQWWHGHTDGAPYTGRHRPMVVPEKQEEALGRILYERFLSGSVPSKNPRQLAQVRRVSARLIAAAGRPDWNWEVNLMDVGPTCAFGVAGDQDKAFALTGGKIGVLSGLADAAGDDDALAAVLAHEMGHAVARHLGEKLSELILMEAGLTAAGALVPGALAVVIPAIVPAAIDAARLVSVAQNIYGFGTPQGKRMLLARFSRAQEEEADHIGLILMAKAGYDPEKAADFWGRLVSETARPAQSGLTGFIAKRLALHAVTADRVAKITALVPSVRSQYFQLAEAH